jgi:hypothetical protein
MITALPILCLIHKKLLIILFLQLSVHNIIYDLYAVYTVPDEFGTSLKFVLLRLFTHEYVLLGGLKFVRFHGSRVFTRLNRPNFSPVPNVSSTV